jgi:Mg/Co/Ni transporter MgtE
MVTLLANTEITAALARELVESHPHDAARVLERLEPEEAWEALRLFDESLWPGIIEGFNSDYAARVLLEAPSEDSTDIVKELPSEVTADLLEYFPEEDKQELLDELSDLHVEELEELSGYEEDTHTLAPHGPNRKKRQLRLCTRRRRQAHRRAAHARFGVVACG